MAKWRTYASRQEKWAEWEAKVKAQAEASAVHLGESSLFDEDDLLGPVETEEVDTSYLVDPIDIVAAQPINPPPVSRIEMPGIVPIPLPPRTQLMQMKSDITIEISRNLNAELEKALQQFLQFLPVQTQPQQPGPSSSNVTGQVSATSQIISEEASNH